MLLATDFEDLNKYDINSDVADEIEEECKRLGITIVGRIPFDTLVNDAVNNLKAIIEYKDSIAAKAIIKMYDNIIKIKFDDKFYDARTIL